MSSSPAIIVTGAAGNLGAAVVRELARGTAPLVLMERSAEKLAALVASLRAGVEVLSIAGTDMTSQEACEAAVAEAVDRFGTVGGLANTVGGFAMAPVAKALSQWDAMLTGNARTALAISAAVLPAMQAARQGRIVHVAALAGQKASAGMAAYAASKAALLRLTEAIAEEYRKDGITANCVLPGVIDTPQNRAAMPDAPFDRWVTPTQLAGVILFLLSDAASAITGAGIPVSGRL